MGEKGRVYSGGQVLRTNMKHPSDSEGKMRKTDEIARAKHVPVKALIAGSSICVTKRGLL